MSETPQTSHDLDRHKWSRLSKLATYRDAGNDFLSKTPDENKLIGLQLVARPKQGKTMNYSKENMLAAVNSVKSNIMSIRKTTKHFEAPRTTLRDRLAGRVSMDAKPSRKPLLDNPMETKLIDYASNRAKMGIGFGKNQFLKYAGAALLDKHNLLNNSIPEVTLTEMHSLPTTSIPEAVLTDTISLQNPSTRETMFTDTQSLQNPWTSETGLTEKHCLPNPATPETTLTDMHGLSSIFSFKNSSFPGDVNNDVLSYPAPTVRKSLAKTAQNKFFVLKYLTF